MQSLSDENKFVTKLSEPSPKGAKRGYQVENDDAAKRAKVDREVHEKKGQQKETVSNKSFSENLDSNIDLAELGDENESGAAEEILVPDDGISDFFALSEHTGLSNSIHCI